MGYDYIGINMQCCAHDDMSANMQMNAKSSYHNLIHRYGVPKSHILQVDSLLPVEWIKTSQRKFKK